ncbi:MAG TPA: nucleotide disphospho-sugar-binding domain-containing protein [Gemmata sp.]|jgi:spore coat polysaccharide biosynthesis predicted glycosyltransferase SpsG|nr:nucleotide disphospho-sugar-binding domain-containing protein [Gemmata sp.]
MDATRGPILFRCDGTPEGGWEPLYQCLSLAAALQRRRRGTLFFSYLEPLSMATGISRANNDWAAAEQPLGSPGDLEATLAQIRKSNAAAVVVAGDGMTPDYLEALKQTGTLVVVFDSSAQMIFPVDVVVNPLLAPGKKPYRVGPGCQRLLGHRFALCRGVFRRQRTIRATEPPQPYRALVAFGDDDPAGETLTRTRQLLEMGKVQKVTVAVRTHHWQYDELLDLADASNGAVEIVTESKELLTRLVRVHFALSGGDMWSPELCVVGIPQLILSQTTRHGMNGKKMDEEGVATFLGHAADVPAEQLREAVDMLLDDPMERKGMSRCARNLFDGRGPDRIVNGMEIMLHAPSRRRTAVSIPINPLLKIAA